MKNVKLSNTYVPDIVYAHSRQVRHMMYVNGLLEIVKAEINYLIIRGVFLARDFFKRYEWNRNSKSNRLILGTLFLKFKRSKNNGIKSNEKISSGQKKYRISYRLKEDF